MTLVVDDEVGGRLELAYSESTEPSDRIHERWDDYRFLLGVARAASLVGAARLLRTTQSAVSKRIDRLERELGVKLVERSPSGTKLTYQGERALAHVSVAHRELERAHISAASANNRIEGDCSILATDGVANYWLPHFLEAFFVPYPNIELKVFLDHDLSAPRNELFDIRLHYHEPTDSSAVAKLLATIHFLPFASRTYLESRGVPESLSDLENHQLLDQSQYLVATGSWATWFHSAHKSTSIFTNQSAFLAKCVAAGVGIALMPSYMVLADPSLVPIDMGVHFSARLFASYRRDSALKQPVRTTLDFLRTFIFDSKQMPWFREELVQPSLEWPNLWRSALAKARQAHGK
ncbi:MAG: LysR family transcriptional regulator [Rhizomicrobium sp.]